MIDQPDLFDEKPFEIPAWLLRPVARPTLPPIRIYSNGYDVTDRMPRTRARLELMRAEAMKAKDDLVSQRTAPNPDR